MKEYSEMYIGAQRICSAMTLNAGKFVEYEDYNNFKP